MKLTPENFWKRKLQNTQLFFFYKNLGLRLGLYTTSLQGLLSILDW